MSKRPHLSPPFTPRCSTSRPTAFSAQSRGCGSTAVSGCAADNSPRLYVASYTFGRFFFENLRIDDAHHLLGMRNTAWVPATRLGTPRLELSHLRSHKFEKRIFTPGLLLNDVGFLLTRGPWMIGAAGNEDITRAFVEKIMTVTTAVNECTYCAWYHAKAAVASGIGVEEVESLLDLQFQATASDFEIMALLYAQHYAETNRQPETQMTARLFDTYGERTAKHIMLAIRVISFGNLFGNTWDAVLSRFKGRPAPESNVAFELAFFFLTFWFMFPAMWRMKTGRKKTEDDGGPTEGCASGSAQ